MSMSVEAPTRSQRYWRKKRVREIAARLLADIPTPTEKQRSLAVLAAEQHQHIADFNEQFRNGATTVPSFDLYLRLSSDYKRTLKLLAQTVVKTEKAA